MSIAELDSEFDEINLEVYRHLREFKDLVENTGTDYSSLFILSENEIFNIWLQIRHHH